MASGISASATTSPAITSARSWAPPGSFDNRALEGFFTGRFMEPVRFGRPAARTAACRSVVRHRRAGAVRRTAGARVGARRQAVRIHRDRGERARGFLAATLLASTLLSRKG
ncbi:hypothetical protein GCM10009551_020400 [Nocardiopsis tropica]